MTKKNEGDALKERNCTFFVPFFATLRARYSELAMTSVIWLKGLHSAHPTLSDVDTLFIR